VDAPPVSIHDGGIIKTGFNAEVDELRSLTGEGHDWLLSYEQQQKEQLGIKSLKVGYNKVFGYYIEITKSNLDQVPVRYVRKQTLVNAERFITEELKEYESRILGARERLENLECRLFVELRSTALDFLTRIQEPGRALGELDSLLALAENAHQKNYVRPTLTAAKRTCIKGGRHPVVEGRLLDDRFVPNDTHLDRNHYLAIITGPNMGGKSTYIRQVALIHIMAQVGSFVPAEEAELGIVDRVFARVGASDDLASGRSTFMVEMSEVAAIINTATEKSLLLLDEIGRGTSTFDGMSIARAVVEHTARQIRARTLFATHYHELTALDEMPGVVNLFVSVAEQGDNVVFLRRVLPGKADKSYGIHVARLAGLPQNLLSRATEILREMESREMTGGREIVCQPALFEDRHPILLELQAMDINELRPVDALNLLAKWQHRLSEE
jgi:DNA mismatch repair protein MutS